MNSQQQIQVEIAAKNVGYGETIPQNWKSTLSSKYNLASDMINTNTTKIKRNFNQNLDEYSNKMAGGSNIYNGSTTNN